MNSTVDYNVGYNRLSSGSIAATVSSGYTGINTEDTDPELTYLPSMYSGSYEGLEGKSYAQHLQGPGSMWPSVMGKSETTHQFQLPSFMNPPSFPQNGRSQMSLPQSQFGSGMTISGGLRQDQNTTVRKIDRTKTSSILSPTPLAGYTFQDANIALLSSKKQFSMNVNAPSYNPVGNNNSISETKEDEKENSQGTNIDSLVGTKLNEKTQFFHLSGKTDNETIEILRMELLRKHQINTALNDKFKILRMDEKSEEEIETENRNDNLVKMPKNYYQLFKDLTRTLNERTKELEETKSRLEAIVVGLVMNKNTTVITNGTFDAQELAHRITNKLEVLQNENESLLKMVSHSNKQSLLIEIGLLKNENNLLRQKVEKMEGKE